MPIKEVRQTILDEYTPRCQRELNGFDCASSAIKIAQEHGITDCHQLYLIWRNAMYEPLRISDAIFP
jgi:hypothetical protein